MEAAFGALIGIAVLVGVFWICRELFCWYWKINARLVQAEQQVVELVAIKNLLRQLVDQNRIASRPGEEIKE